MNLKLNDRDFLTLKLSDRDNDGPAMKTPMSTRTRMKNPTNAITIIRIMRPGTY